MFITLSTVFGMEGGTLALRRPFNSTAYISNAVYAAAHGINSVLDDGLDGALANEYTDANGALSDAVLVHSRIAAAKFDSTTTEGDVRFSPSGALLTSELEFVSISGIGIIQVGTWSKDDGLSEMRVHSWPSGDNTPPNVGCAIGNALVGSVCEPCGAGWYSPGGLVACKSCPRGKYTPSEGNGYCVPCSVWEIALTNGSTFCSACPTGADCSDAGKLVVNPGYWRIDESSGFA